MYKLFNWMFGWDYVAWENTCSSGVARVHSDAYGKPYYNWYGAIMITDNMYQNVVWLTCTAEAFADKHTPVALYKPTYSETITPRTTIVAPRTPPPKTKGQPCGERTNDVSFTGDILTTLKADYYSTTLTKDEKDEKDDEWPSNMYPINNCADDLDKTVKQDDGDDKNNNDDLIKIYPW